METLNLTQEQLNQLSNLILEIPTRYGMPIHSLISSFIQAANSKGANVTELSTEDATKESLVEEV